MTSPYAIALSHFGLFGPKTYLKLFEYFKDYEPIWKASVNELRSAGITENLAEKFVTWRDKTNVDEVVNSVFKLGIDTVDRNDPRFPAALKTIHDPPIILYTRGTLPESNLVIGIVGAREATDYGLKIAKQFANELSQAGLVVVSGLARGIDCEAHEGAMMNGGQTVAVLAHGLEELRGSKKIFGNRIIESGGAIITEQPPYLQAEKFHFPIRNRIIAGMSRGVLVVEAKLPSGSLTTAQAALQEHRDVFAIPGPINSPVSAGTNKLLQDGAWVTTSTNDIFLAFGMPAAKPPLEPLLEPPVASLPKTEPTALPLPQTPLTSEQAAIMAALTTEPLHIDELTRKSALPAAVVLAALTILEIHGNVRHLGNMHYVKI